MIKKRVITSSAPLDPEVAAILIGGWSAQPLDGEPTKGFTPPLLDLFMGHDEGLVRLWLQHEGFLRAEAQRLGIVPDWPQVRDRGPKYFFGEYVMRAGAPAHAGGIEED